MRLLRLASLTFLSSAIMGIASVALAAPAVQDASDAGAPAVPDAPAANGSSTAVDESHRNGEAPARPATPEGTAPYARVGLSSPRSAEPEPNGHEGRFEFGSYGRVSIASDLRGGMGRPANIVAYGPRWDLDSYAEFELRRDDEFKNEDIKTRVVLTMAFFPPFFHFDGKPLDSVGVRNLYAQGTYKKWLTLWGGSRMYRGDDIYLLNWWPLDNQNTVGGGAFFSLPDDWTLAAHAGASRQDNGYQYQAVQAVSPFGFGTVTAPFLDRPRAVETFKVTKMFRNSAEHHYFGSDKMGIKVVGYAEAHQISAGTRRDTDPNVDVTLPSDSGFLLGAQATLWTGERDTYVSLVGRYAKGLAAYDPFATPVGGLNGDSTKDASDLHFALAGNFEKDWFGILWGSYIRFFRGGTASTTQPANFDEGTIDVRPQVYLGEHFGVAVDASWQLRRFAANASSTNEFVNAQLFRTMAYPYFSPWGRGSYKRPQIGLIGGVTFRNDDARSLYPQVDPFSQRPTEYYAGMLVEWWFNSTSYP